MLPTAGDAGSSGAEASPVMGRQKAGTHTTPPQCSLLSDFLSPPFLRRASCSFLLPSCEMSQSTTKLVQMQTSAFQEPSKLSALESHPVKRRGHSHRGWEAHRVTPNSARLSLMALADQPVILPWFPIPCHGSYRLTRLLYKCVVELRMWEEGRFACTDGWNVEGVQNAIRA